METWKDPFRSRERAALRRIIMAEAARCGMPVGKWLQAHGMDRKTVSKAGRPSLDTVYRVCDAAGVKVSDYFRGLGL